MEEFIARPASSVALYNRFEKDPRFIPHVTDARHVEIYRSNIELISYAGDRYIYDVVYFYGLLERIKGQIDGLYLPSYRRISAQGKLSVINRIYDDAGLTVAAGTTILMEMEGLYPKYQLTRKIRKPEKVPQYEQLATRLQKLGSDLDRVRTTHG